MAAAGRFEDDKNHWLPVLLPADVLEARVSCAVLLANPRACVTTVRYTAPAATETAEVVTIDKPMRHLLDQVNGTAHANVRRDGFVMTRLDETVSPSAIVLGTIDFDHAAALLTKLAVEVSGSNVGACYIREPQHKRLRCVAAYVPSDLRPGVIYPPEIDTDGLRAAAQCVREHGRVFYDGSSSVDGDSLASTTSQAVELEPAELATPIPGPLVSRRTPAVGVLTVARVRPATAPDVTSYGAYDHAVLRNIALRLALLRATTNVEAAGEIFRSLPVARYRSAGRAAETTAAGSMGRARRGKDFPTPDDLDIAIPAITGGLERLAVATASHSATFRAALPDSTTVARHGLVLVRLAASPPGSLNTRGRIQAEPDGGVNWTAVRNGKPQYIPNVHNEPEYFSSRDETVSQLSIPVIVEGRVIGVVNLESPLEHGYDGQIATAQAFAERIALIIANARLAVTRQAQEYAAKIISRGHEMAEQCTKLRELTGFNPHTRRDLTELADVIERKARGLRTFPTATPVAGGRATLPQLVSESISRAQTTRIRIVEDRALAWMPHSSITAEALRECCYHVVMNVKRHSPVVGGFRESEIRLYQDVWGGQQHDIAVVRNVSYEPIDAYSAINLYRAPIERTLGAGDDGAPGVVVPHFGAYLAGTLARLTGGDVYLSAHRGRDIRLTLSVPSPESNQQVRAEAARTGD